MRSAWDSGQAPVHDRLMTIMRTNVSRAYARTGARLRGRVWWDPAHQCWAGTMTKVE